MKTPTYESYRDMVLSEYEKGNIVYRSCEGTVVMPIESFLEQPLEGILYDLNRDESVILLFIDEEKWVNDFALTKVLKAMHAKLEKAEPQKCDVCYSPDSRPSCESCDEPSQCRRKEK